MRKPRVRVPASVWVAIVFAATFLGLSFWDVARIADAGRSAFSPSLAYALLAGYLVSKGTAIVLFARRRA